MEEEINKLFAQYIRATLINNDVLMDLFQTNSPGYTIIDNYIYEEKKKEKEKKRNRFQYYSLDKHDKGRGVQNILNSKTKEPTENTLNFIAILFEITPKSLREFGSQWRAKKITKKDLTINIDDEQKEDFDFQNEINDICSYIENYPEKKEQILPHFIGRKFVFDKIDEFIAKNDKGYFFLKADAGIGKTSFAFKLVNERNCPFHMIKSQGNNKGNSVKDFIKNICAQLICDKKLAIKEFPEDYDDDGVFLQAILREVSEKLLEDEKFVIVVDGIDELQQKELTMFANESILYLPELLPRNIFFILTMRDIEKGISLPKSENFKSFKIESKGEENLEDAQLFIKESIKKEGVQDYLKKHNTTEDEFVKKLESKSRGNFMYLYYILKEIEGGDYKDTKLEELPQGLEGYYKEHWNRMMTVSKEVNEVKLKTIYVLANMEDPISCNALTEIIKSDTESVKHGQIQQIIDSWRQFLEEKEDEDGEKEYVFYHKSFLDFLASNEHIKAIGKDYSKIAERVELDFYDKNIDDILNEDDEI